MPVSIVIDVFWSNLFNEISRWSSSALIHFLQTNCHSSLAARRQEKRPGRQSKLTSNGLYSRQTVTRRSRSHRQVRSHMSLPPFVALLIRVFVVVISGWPTNQEEWKSPSKNVDTSKSSAQGFADMLDKHCSDMKSIAGHGGVGWFWQTWSASCPCDIFDVLTD